MLRTIAPVAAFDFQGLIQSALVGRASRPKVFWGFDRSVAREPLASALYDKRVCAPGPHRIQRNLQLVRAAGAAEITDQPWLPVGVSEGELPSEPFVLASPFAGWAGKQWPVASYDELGSRLNRRGFQLVLNVASHNIAQLDTLRNARTHVSSIAGLIGATRRAAAVVGVDSGPLHLAAALRKPGVAIYGPTDPATNGPYGGSMLLLRNAEAETTYHRHRQIQPSMKSVTVETVLEALDRCLHAHNLGVSR